MRQNLKCPNCGKFTIGWKLYPPNYWSDRKLGAGAVFIGIFVFAAGIALEMAFGGFLIGAFFVAIGIFKFMNPKAECYDCRMQFSKADIDEMKQGGKSTIE